MKCRQCKSINIATNLRPDTIHYAEYRCNDCDTFLSWVGKPQYIKDLALNCEVELDKAGFTWYSLRVLDFCERATGRRDHRYLRENHLRILLRKLKELTANAPS